MRLKDDSISLVGLRPELLFAILVAQEVYQEYGYDLVITSVNDGNHSLTSLHYAGAAVDLRTTYFNPNENWDEVAEEIQERLNRHYDVINEHNHIHLEWQPRQPI